MTPEELERADGALAYAILEIRTLTESVCGFSGSYSLIKTLDEDLKDLYWLRNKLLQEEGEEENG